MTILTESVKILLKAIALEVQSEACGIYLMRIAGFISFTIHMFEKSV